MDIDDAYGLLRGAKSVVDLCAAPGSWCQVLKQRCGASCKVVAVDVQAMQPLMESLFYKATSRHPTLYKAYKGVFRKGRRDHLRRRARGQWFTRRRRARP